MILPTNYIRIDITNLKIYVLNYNCDSFLLHVLVSYLYINSGENFIVLTTGNFYVIVNKVERLCNNREMLK